MDITEGRPSLSRVSRLSHEQLLDLLDGVRERMDTGEVEAVYGCITRLLDSNIGSDEYHRLTMELARMMGQGR